MKQSLHMRVLQSGLDTIGVKVRFYEEMEVQIADGKFKV